MASKITPEVLNQRWIHSHEEDTDSETVFRPATFKFPPSRGRAGFALRPDGTAVEIGIGPTDRPQEETGTWRMEGDNQLVLSTPSASGRPRVMEVVSADKDRLVVKK
jgi:hypothetical protein